MNNITILNTFEAFLYKNVIWNWGNWTLNCSVLLILFIILAITFSSERRQFLRNLFSVLAITCFVVGFFCSITTIDVYETRYQILIEENTKVKDILSEYEIIDEQGMTLIVRDKDKP